MTTVLILDADQRSALAATRALGEAGYTIHTADHCHSALAACSKWSSNYVRHPDPTSDPDGAIKSIADYCNSKSIDLIFPMTDVSTHLIQSADRPLPAAPCPPRDIYEEASDKGTLMQIAHDAGVQIPKTYYVDRDQHLEQLPEGFQYPVVLKPRRSRIRVQGGYLHTQVTIARDAAHLAHLQNEHRWLREHPWLLQSFIEGTGQGVFALYQRGNPIAWFAHERLREKPPAGGVSVYSRSAPLESRLREASSALLNALAWHGPAMVEFRVAEDGTPYLMEINARFWGSLQLAISAGVNFPALSAQLARGKSPEAQQGYRLGVSNRWLLGDLDHLYLKFKGSEYSWGEKLRSLARFLMPWRTGMRYEVLRWSDPGPFRHELARYLGFGE